ncbi:very long-chain acyl-CoA synthetase [Lingula anatina]|uniref:Very long-chain fatty acid transport protein n=1 Tax=Lingula anatina TaxID=7574 RepID=A0A1S3KGQ8_LINAN|nr:very long-chain acyl-CoA synthetase [Lingula anatina]|eukprot:XP_013421672.1 very long-chain acyl-CoA synthetase [Lingula anatina]
MWSEVLFSSIAGIAGGLLFVHFKWPWVWKDLSYIIQMIKSLKKFEYCVRNQMMIADVFDDQAAKFPNKPMIVFEGKEYTWSYVNEQSNKVARLAEEEWGLKCGDTVAIMIYNEPEFIWTFIGLLKIGVGVALLNHNLRAKSLVMCFTRSEAKILVIGKGDELLKAAQDVLPDLKNNGVSIFVQGQTQETLQDGFKSFDDLMSRTSNAAIPKSRRSGLKWNSPVCYIYTSGTTGLPKPAVLGQYRFLRGSFILPVAGFSHDDRVYTALPLYHSSACIIGLGGVITEGATMLLKKKFSASHFWEDCREQHATYFLYIGEICRYLLSRPRHPDDAKHSIRCAVGNGLRADIWKEFQERFQIPKINEFYACTEGNVGFFNLFNKVGAVGRLSPILHVFQKAYLVKFDIEKEEVIRDENGLCIPVGPDAPGLLIGEISKRQIFEGYKGKEEQTKKKILHDVFKKGDAYFNSGDLLYYDPEYYLYFSDRVGDTFRWKGENVSTTEVSNVLADVEGIEDACTYGVPVPGHDGQAGMSVITLQGTGRVSSGLLKVLYTHCTELLPSYARPLFLRIQPELVLTSTFKQVKGEFKKQGFDPDAVPHPLYFLDATKKTYVPLTGELYRDIISDKIRI